jgi:hypothetical protein
MASYVVMCNELTGDPVAVTYIDPDTNVLMYSMFDGSGASVTPPVNSKRCCECNPVIDEESLEES